MNTLTAVTIGGRNPQRTREGSIAPTLTVGDAAGTSSRRTPFTTNFAGISSLAETRVVPGANILTPVEGTITGNHFYHYEKQL
jgi:hypothetical protein